MSGKAFDRVVRKSHILSVFKKKFEGGYNNEFTSPQVARALMLEPSAHVRGLLAELVREDVLECRLIEDERTRNLKNSTGKTAYYRLSEKTIKQIEDDARKINVRVNGVTVTQIRMF